VEISFKTKKLQKNCSEEQAMVCAYGQDRAKRLKQRLAELKAADTLSDISHLPPARLHELTGSLKGCFSVDLTHPYRLLFVPDHDTVPEDEQGGIDRRAVTAIEIVDIRDTH